MKRNLQLLTILIPFLLLTQACTSIEKKSKNIKYEVYNFKTINKSVKLFPTSGGLVKDTETLFTYPIGSSQKNEYLTVNGNDFFIYLSSITKYHKAFSKHTFLNDKSDYDLITVIESQSPTPATVKLDHKVSMSVRYILMKKDKVIFNKVITTNGQSKFKENFVGGNRHADAFAKAATSNIYQFLDQLKGATL